MVEETTSSHRSTIFKKDIVEYLHKRFPDLLKSDLYEVVDLFFNAITSALQNGRRVEFRGFGNISVSNQKGRTFKNPKTGKITICASSKRIVFRPGTRLRT